MDHNSKHLSPRNAILLETPWNVKDGKTFEFRKCRIYLKGGALFRRAYLEHSSRHQQKAAETLERKFVRAMKKARDENQLLIAENMDLRQDKKTLMLQLQKVRKETDSQLRKHPFLSRGAGK
jgi:transposase